MPHLQDLLKHAQAGDIEASKEFLEWAEGEEPQGATLARVDEVVGRGPLHRAAEFGHADYVKWILTLQIDHLQPDKTSTTPLHLACVNGHVEAVKALLDFDGPSLKALNKTNEKGETGWHWAAMKGHIEVMRLLNTRSNGALKQTKDARGNTALHYTAKNNHEEATEFLLKIKCEPSAINKDGEMPIHLACREAALASLYPLCVAMPLRDRSEKNASGKTPVDVSTTHAAREMVTSSEPKRVASKMTYINPDVAEDQRNQRRAADEKRGVAKRSFANSKPRASVDDYDDFL